MAKQTFDDIYDEIVTMEIVRGDGPFNLPVIGSIEIGELMTLVAKTKGKSSKYCNLIIVCDCS